MLEGQKGCFSVNSMNQFAVLPRAAQEILSRSLTFLKDLIAKNVEAEKPAVNPTVLAEMILTFFYRPQLAPSSSAPRSTLWE